MRKIPIILLLMFFCLGYSQEQKIDKNSSEFQEIIEIYNKAQELKSNQNFNEAVKVYQLTLDTFQKKFDVKHHYYGQILTNLAQLYKTMGDYKKALPLYLEALENTEKTLGKNHSKYAIRLSNLASLYKTMRDYKKALPLYLEAIENTEKTLGKDHSAYGIHLSNLASLYNSMGDYKKALPLCLEALENTEKTLGKNHSKYAIRLSNLASLYKSMGDYKKALPLYLEALENTEKTLGKDHKDYTIRLSSLASLYKTMEDYKKALPFYIEAIENTKKTLGKDHKYYAIDLINLASLYKTMGDYKKALPLYLEALENTEKTLGKDHKNYAIRLSNLASLYKTMRDYKKALPLCLEVIENAEKTLGKDHPAYGIHLNNLASLYNSMGDYKKALPLYLEALENTEKTLGKNHSKYAIRLSNLASLYKTMRDYKKALPLYLEAIENTEKTLGKDHSTYGVRLSNLASLYKTMGDYKKALPLNIEALENIKKTLGKDHSIYGFRLNELAHLYTKKGDYNKALPLYIEALGNAERTLGKDHSMYGFRLNELAHLYTKKGDYNKALPLYLEALENAERTLGKDHSIYGFRLNELAYLYTKKGDYNKALPLYIEALGNAKRRLGKDHSTYGVRLNELAHLYTKKGDYNKALPLYLEALENAERTLGKDHSIYGFRLNELAFLYTKKGDYNKALPLYIDALGNAKRTLGKDHSTYGVRLNELAHLYTKKGDYKKALPLYIEALENAEKTLGKDHQSYGIYLNNLASLYETMKDYKKALPLYLEALENTEKTLGKDHSGYGIYLYKLAFLYESMKDYKKALPLYLEALEVAEKTLGKEDKHYAIGLSHLASLYKTMGDYKKALPLYIEALENTGKTLGKDHSDYGIRLNNLAILYESMGDYKKAHTLYLEALENTGKTLGEEHSRYKRYLFNLSLFNKDMPQYRKANNNESLIKSYKLKVSEYKSLINKGDSLYIEKKYKGALHQYTNARDLIEKISDLKLLYNEKIHKSILDTQTKLKQHYSFDELVDYYGKTYGDMSTEVGLHYIINGDYNNNNLKIAENSFKIAINCYLYSNKINNPHYLKAKSSYFNILKQRNDINKQLKVLNFEISLTTNEDYKKSIIIEYINLVKSDKSRTKDYESKLLEYLKIEREYEENYVKAFIWLNNLYIDHQEYEKSFMLFKNNEAIINELDSKYNYIYRTIASVFVFSEKPDKNQSLLKYVNLALEYHESINEKYIKKVELILYKSLALVKLGKIDEAKEVVIDCISKMEEKNLIESEKYAEILDLKAKIWPDLDDDSEKKLLKRRIIAYETNDNYGEDYYSAIIDYANILALEKKYNQSVEYYLKVHRFIFNNLKNELKYKVSSSKEFKINNFTTNFFSIIQYLNFELNGSNEKINKMATEASLLSKNLKFNTTSYVFRTLRSRKDSVTDSYIEKLNKKLLEYSATIDWFKSINSHSADRILKRYKALNVGLYDMLMQRNNSKNLIEIPNINNINLEPNSVFVDYHRVKNFKKENIYLAYIYTSKTTIPKIVNLGLEDKLKNILALNSLKNLSYKTRGSIPSSKSKNITIDNKRLYEFILSPIDSIINDYKTIYFSFDGLLNKVPLAAIQDVEGNFLAEKYKLNQISNVLSLIDKNNKEANLNDILCYGGINYNLPKNNNFDAKFSHLPGTLTEVNNIKLLFPNTIIIKGDDATEKQFWDLSGESPSVIHIATHGFYNVFDDNSKNRFKNSKKPLKRSGLLLSNGNIGFNEVINGPDGILTSEEISYLDLRNTNLVVLSACETGLGDVEGSEGVYGLQRAFKMAGVKTIIMSLWEVPDAETAEFMNLFYTKWKELNNPKKAFKQAQNVMMKKYRNTPEKWAAFVYFE